MYKLCRLYFDYPKVHFGEDVNCQRGCEGYCVCPRIPAELCELSLTGMELTKDEDCSSLGVSVVSVPSYTLIVWVISVNVPVTMSIGNESGTIWEVDEMMSLDVFYTPWQVTAESMVGTLFSKLDEYVADQKDKYPYNETFYFDTTFKEWLEEALGESLLPQAVDAIRDIKEGGSFYAQYDGDTWGGSGQKRTMSFTYYPLEISK